MPRENILTSQTARDDFLDGVRQLDQESSGITAANLFTWLQNNGINLSMQGVNQNLSTYDLFVFWHVVAMTIPLATGNMAHAGPIFLPWHRMYLIRLEEQVRRILQKPNFFLPYWDWAADGQLGEVAQRQTQLWTSQYLGESRGQVASGLTSQIQVRLTQVNTLSGSVLVSHAPRNLERNAGSDVRTLPDKTDTAQAMNESIYDQAPWSVNSSGFRNRLEGWINGPQLHNRVHVWVGGDMGPGTSPNDPVFYLNHCNVDRIWEAWMVANGRNYLPVTPMGAQGHRLNDLMLSILDASMRPSDVLDPNPWYTYDSLVV
ncbi:MAG: tyrosinase family protein [Saprospiraceae bacterium]|nr:tyrosinase family protein [Saprospiraceae bacterium]